MPLTAALLQRQQRPRTSPRHWVAAQTVYTHGSQASPWSGAAHRPPMASGGIRGHGGPLRGPNPESESFGFQTSVVAQSQGNPTARLQVGGWEAESASA